MALLNANLQAMRLHGLRSKTIDSYSRTLRRVTVISTVALMNLSL